jgi:hypothetical protein
MDNRKWLKRKYPKSFDLLNDLMDDERLYGFKNNRFKLGKLVKDKQVDSSTKYPKGTIIWFKRSNPVKDFNHPQHYAICKCNDGAEDITESGYHSFDIYEKEFKEIFE